MSPSSRSGRRTLPGAKPAKQLRSQATLDRISDAVMELLRDKPFDQLSVAEIVEASNISTGTFYRRFDNKTALLPLLFERYAEMMGRWFQSLAAEDAPEGLDGQVRAMVAKTYDFYAEHRNFIRAVHLHSRYRPELIDREGIDRRVGPPRTYHGFLDPVADEIGPPLEEAVPFVFFILTTAMNERMLYADHGTARTLPMDEAGFCAHLEAMLLAYLRG